MNKFEESPEEGERNLSEEHVLPSTIKHDPSTTNNEPSTANMEVHHHPQLEHKSKPWKEYLLEGLMIFLAVTLGFFAENFREQISDSHREYEFAKELYAELKDDSIAAVTKMRLRQEKEQDMEYVSSFFKDSVLTKPSQDAVPGIDHQFVPDQQLCF